MDISVAMPFDPLGQASTAEGGFAILRFGLFRALATVYGLWVLRISLTGRDWPGGPGE